MSLTTGQLVGGHYEVIERLGGGGFGETYLSRDLHLPDHPLRVIKRLSPKVQEASVLQLSRRLFETEAQVLYRLGTHPQIPQLFAHFEELSEFYLVQEFIDGHDLGHELLRGKIWQQFAVMELLQNLLTVLSFVHQHNVIHRDIKPENIIRRRDGQLFLIDFGVVKEIATQTIVSTRLSGEQTNYLESQPNYTVGIGTPGYMPSEQAHGEPKFASDIYAIGMIGIQALTGIPPNQLAKDDNLEIIWREYALKVYPEFADVLARMVRFDFRQRYPNAAKAHDALQEVSDRYPNVNISNSNPNIPNNSLTTILIDSSSNKSVNQTSDQLAVPQDEQVQKQKSNQSELWRHVQPWHLGLGIVTLGAIAITTVILLVSVPAKSPSPITSETSKELSNPVPPEVPTNSIQAVNGLPTLIKEFSIGDANGAIYGVTVSPNGKLVAGAGSDQNIDLWNLLTGKKILTLKGHTGRVYDIFFSPDGKRLVSAGDDRKVIVWDVKAGKILNNLEGHQERVYTAIFSPDGKAIASSSADRTVRLWNAETGKLMNILQEKSTVYDISYTPDSKILATGCKDGSIHLWNVETGKLIKTVTENGSSVRSIVYSNDGKLIATAMEDNTVRLWDGVTGQFKEVLTGHTGEVHTITFSNDDRLLASGSADKSMRIWHLKEKRPSQVVSGFERGVASVDFSPDNKFLISGSLDGKIKIWQFSP